jgi:hypothetical protein
MKAMHWKNGFRSSLAMIGLAAVLGLGGGCDRSAGSAGPFDETASAVSGRGLDERLATGPFATLTVEQIGARVKLTAEQRITLQTALDRARATRDERVNHARRGAWGRRAHGGRPAFGPAAGEAPVLVFLEDASKALTPDQFAQLARLLKEERDQWTAERSGRHGKDARGPSARRPRGRGEGMSERRGAGAGPGARTGFEALVDRAAGYLDLTDAQRERIRSIVDERAVEMRELRSRVDSGATTPEEARDGMRAIRNGTRDQIKGVLTAEQWEKADAFRTERVGEQIDARMDRMEDQIQRRGLFLERVLDLAPAQASHVQDLLKETVPARKEILGGVRAGTLAPEDAAMRVLDLERSAAAQIGSLLTPEQMVRWEAVKDLLPRGGPGRGF